MELLQCLHMVIHTEIIHADQLKTFGCQMRCLYTMQMYDTTRYLSDQYNLFIWRKQVMFGSYHLYIRVDIETALAAVKYGHASLGNGLRSSVINRSPN